MIQPTKIKYFLCIPVQNHYNFLRKYSKTEVEEYFSISLCVYVFKHPTWILFMLTQ